MKTSPGIAAKMFRTLADEGVNIEMISTSTIRISVVVAAADWSGRPAALHTAFGLDSGQALLRRRCPSGSDPARRAPASQTDARDARRKQHVPWRAAGTASEQQRSADDVVRETGWVFNNVTGDELNLAEFVEHRRPGGRRLPARRSTCRSAASGRRPWSRSAPASAG